MPIVKMPDGTQVRFPDEMPKEQIRALILQKFPDIGNPAPQQDSQADPNAQAVAAGLPVVDPNAPGADGNSNAPLPPMMMNGTNIKGLLTPGNTDLTKRPIVHNPDGSISTVRSMSFENNKGQEVLIPTVADDGSRILSNKEAMEQYGRTGKHLGIFDNPDDATAYAESLHDQQDQMYAGGKPPQGGPSPAFQQALAQLHQAAGSLKDAPTEDRDRLVRANMEATKIQNMQGDKGLLRRAAEAIPGGATGGFADELYSGTIGGLARMARDGVGYGEAYKREQALAAAQKRKRGDAANIIGDVAGGLALGAGATAGPLTMTSGGTVAAARPAWGGLTLTGRATGGLGKTAAAMGEGGAYGGLYGAGNASEGHRLEEGAKGAAIGAATGGLLEGAGNVASRILSPKGPATRSAADLAQEGTALYNQATNAGVTVNQGAVNHAAGNVTMKLQSFGFDKDLQPKTAIVLKRLLESRNKPLTLTELENLRKMATTAAREAADASDRKAAGIIVDQIDNIVNDTSNFSAGSSQALEALKAGREVWRRKMKTEILEDIAEKAQNQATGVENGLVIHLRALANNKSKFNAFSKEEKKLILSVVRRGSAHGALRALGMLAPNSTFGGLVTGGTAVGSGLLPGAALAATGAAAKAGAGALTRSKVNTLQRVVSTGVSNLPMLPNYLRPAIGATTAGATGLLPRSSQPIR